MELLRNQKEFDDWKEGNIYAGDEADQPNEFPCWVYTIVISWNCEEQAAVYLYRADLVDMLDKMTF